MKIFRASLLVVSLGLGLAVNPPAHAETVTLQQATATFSQADFTPAQAIDRSIHNNGGWAILRPDSSTQAEVAVFETATDVGFAAGSTLTFALHQHYATGVEIIGRFRISVTTDDRTQFADGLTTGGDVTANWIVLEPESFASRNGSTATKLDDHSLLIGGPDPGPSKDVFEITVPTTLTGITGVRLEVMEDPSLPTGGPGKNPADGNFVLSELEMEVTAPAAEPLAGLVAWWPGENAVADIVGESHVTAAGDTQIYQPGKVGQAFSFNGIDQSATTPLLTDVMNQVPLTIEGWVKPRARTSGSIDDPLPPNVICNDRSLYGGHGFGVHIYPDGSKLNIGVQGEEADFRTIPGVTFTPDVWVHVAVVYSPGKAKTYVNGALVDTFTYTQAPMEGDSVVRLGRHNDDTGYGTRRFFMGEIDELSLFNRSLSGPEIGRIHLAGAGGKTRHDVALDYSTRFNPGRVWSYRWLPLSSSIAPYDPAQADNLRLDGPNENDGEGINSWFTPASVTYNTTGNLVSYYNAGAYSHWLPYQFGLHPGTSEYAIVRWTAPRAGQYAVSGTFTGGDTRPTSVDVHMFHKAALLMDGTINSYGGNGVTHTRTITVAANDTVDFLVGTGGNGYYYDNTRLAASVVPLDGSSSTLEAPTWLGDIDTPEPYMTGRNWRFEARSESRADFPGLTARIQYTSTPANLNSWADLPGGEMVPSSGDRFIVDISSMPVGFFAFRIATTDPGTGETTYSTPTDLLHVLTARPYYVMEMDVATASDSSGQTTHQHDLITYTVRFRNSGIGEGSNLSIDLDVPPDTEYSSGDPGAKLRTLGDRRIWSWNLPRVYPTDDLVPFAVADLKTGALNTLDARYPLLYDPEPLRYAFNNGEVVRVRSGGTLPGGLETNKNYYIVSSRSTQVSLSATPGGPAIRLPSKGVGLHQIRRVSDWQTRKITLSVASPSSTQARARVTAGLPPMNPVGADLLAIAALKLPDGEAITGSDLVTSRLVNPLRVSVVQKSSPTGIRQGGLVPFEITVKNEASVRVTLEELTVRVPAGLTLQSVGDGPVFYDASGNASGPPIDPVTKKQVKKPTSWFSNPWLLDTLVPRLNTGYQPVFEQQARFAVGNLLPGGQQKVRVTCRIQYGWDPATSPALAFHHVTARSANGRANWTRTQAENSVELDVAPAPPDSAAPSLHMWLTQVAAGTLTDDANVATVVNSLAIVPDSSPSRSMKQIRYRVSYANLGNADAGFVRLWIPIPENTFYIANSARLVHGQNDANTSVITNPSLKPYYYGVKRDVNDPLSKTDYWLTCEVPYLESWPDNDSIKTFEFRVAIQSGLGIGTRVSQLGGIMASREVFLISGTGRPLEAEVVPPAMMTYYYDRTATITQNSSGTPTGLQRVRHRALYENRGGAPAFKVGIRYEIPKGLKFKAARFVDFTTGKVVRTSGITAPASGASSGTVTFNVGTVNSKAKGTVEVVLEPDLANMPNESNEPNALKRYQARARFETFDSTTPPAPPPASGATLLAAAASSNSQGTLIEPTVSADNMRLSVMASGPSTVQVGDEITYQVAVLNLADSGHNAGGFIYLRIPSGTEYVRSEVGGQLGGTVSLIPNVLITEPGSGTAAQLGIDNPNGIITQGMALGPHACVVLNFTVRVLSYREGGIVFQGPVFVHGEAGGAKTCDAIVTSIVHPDDSIQTIRERVFEIQTGIAGRVGVGTASSPNQKFLDARNQIGLGSTVMAIGGADHFTVAANNVIMIPLGGGRIVAAGAGNLIGPDGGSVVGGTGGAMVAAGGGNIVAAGAGNLVNVVVPGSGRLTGSQLVPQIPQLVAAGAGNIVAAGGLNLIRRTGLIGPDGASLIGMDGASLIGMDGASLIGMDGATLATISQKGGVNAFIMSNGSRLAFSPTGQAGLVAAGAGNLIGLDGASLIGLDGASLIGKQGFPSLVAAGGGNIVAAGGLNLLPGNGIVAAGAGNLVAAGAGNLVAAGAGNLVAAGAGNLVSTSTGAMVAAGAGN